MWKGNTADLILNGSGVAILKMNRPEALNALNIEMLNEMIHAIKLAEASGEVRVLVITGEGRAFSSGGDIDLLESMASPIEAKETFDLSMAMVQAVYDFKKLAVAAVQGFVAGASASMMMSCDAIIAGDNVRVGFSFINIAFCPDSGCAFFLTRRAGYHRAFDILAQGKFLTVQEARDIGLVTSIVPADQVLPRALDYAESLANSAYRTLLMNKYILREAEKNTFHQIGEQEALHQVLAWSSEDFQEGCRAFKEKRKPVFSGK